MKKMRKISISPTLQVTTEQLLIDRKTNRSVLTLSWPFKTENYLSDFNAMYVVFLVLTKIKFCTAFFIKDIQWVSLVVGTRQKKTNAFAFGSEEKFLLAELIY